MFSLLALLCFFFNFAPMKKLFFLTFSLLSLICSLAGGIFVHAEGYLPVRNFFRDDYAAGTQNWVAVQDSLGRMFFGNNQGLLTFDGARWRTHYLPNSTTVRSLSLDPASGRIYAGATNEFGYFAPDSLSGALRYRSLLPTLAEEDRNFSEIWNILQVGNKVWFQGDFALFRFDGKSTIAFPMENRIAKSAYVNSNIYIAFQNGELMRFNGTRTEPLPGCEILRDKKIAALLPFTDNRSLLIATALDGLFLYDGSQILPIQTYADPILKENQIFCATKSGANYAFGTVNDGAIILDMASRRYKTVNRHNGMQNNTVLATFFDRSDNLWMMLDNGIDYALCCSPITSLLSRREEIGAGYASIIFNGSLYLGTNQALYSRPATSDGGSAPLHRELSGQIWGLDTIGGTLFALGDAGIFYKSGGEFRKVENVEGGYRIALLKGSQDHAIVSTYSRFHLLQRQGSNWVDAGAIRGYDDIGGNFFQAPDGTIWKSHWIKGIYRLTLTPDARAFSKIELFDEHAGLPTPHNNSATLIDGVVYISSEDGIFRYDSKRGGLVRDSAMTSMFSREYSGHLYHLPDGSLLKVNNREFSRVFSDISGEIIRDTSTFRPIAERLIPGFEHINFLSPQELIVSSQDGFKFLNLQPQHTHHWKAPTFVSAIFSGDSLLYSPPTRDRMAPLLKIGPDNNSIRIEFTTTDFESPKGVEFSTRLDNYDKDWSPFSFETSRDYTHLSEGSYTFRIRSRLLATGEISETAFEFRILPPWYRSVWAYIIYGVLLILGIIYGLRALRRWKRNAEEEARRRKESELSERIRSSERETLLKDHEIAVLKSEQLEVDIKHKSSELGNITMNLIRKNEILSEIDSKIARLQADEESRKAHPGLYKSLAGIRKSISENISHDDDWKRFTENFDIVYQDYTRRLHERHPDLTPADIRICCYIRMGLSSKEIAPLVNISFRSVEMVRYRLRKKINLDRDTNLSDYLHSL